MTEPGLHDMPPPSTEPLVELRDVNKWFGELHVLKDINLTEHRGEAVVVIGPSGSGKSTLCRTINRLETLNSGDIRVAGTRLPEEGNRRARLRAGVRMVYKSFNLRARKAVLDNVTLGPTEGKGMRAKEARDRAKDLLEPVVVANQAGKLPAQPS